MAIPLYDVSVASFLQTLGGVQGFLDKGLAHLKANDIDPGSVCGSRLYPDMLDFCFQIQSVAHHSADAIEGCKKGEFTPSGPGAERDFDSLQRLLAEARARLEAETPDEINALEGREVVFKFGEMRMPFTAENFLLSFSLPNLHFHATTAYDILRSKGVPLGKRDYMGPLRLKR